MRVFIKTVAWPLLALALILGSVRQARANVETLTFEGLQNEEEILNYYNGGTGSLGSGPGPNYGIAFSSNSLALTSGNYSNNPSGVTIAFFLNGTADTMNVAGGFTTGFSFYYAGADEGSVTVWSGLDGTGTELASIDLPPTPNPYTVWVPIGVTFSGTAESVEFGGSANYIGFDNITLGSNTPGVAPAPPSIVLAGSGVLSLLVFGLWRRRKLVTA